MGVYYKRKYRLHTFPASATLQTIESYLNDLEFTEEVISFSQTPHGMSVLIKYTYLEEYKS